MYDASRSQGRSWCNLSRAPEIVFRPLTPGDAQELSYLELEIFPVPWSENSLRDCLELSSVEGEAATIAGRIAAYLIVQCVYEEAHILNLAVHRPFRGLGLSRKLLQRFLARAEKRGINLFYLEVRARNRVAQNLYFSLGFAPLKKKKKYYPDGEDALILVRRCDL